MDGPLNLVNDIHKGTFLLVQSVHPGNELATKVQKVWTQSTNIPVGTHPHASWALVLEQW